MVTIQQQRAPAIRGENAGLACGIKRSWHEWFEKARLLIKQRTAFSIIALISQSGIKCVQQMPSSSQSAEATSCRGANFRTTHWSVVLQAGRDSSPDASAALEKLCRTYWYPIYVYARRQGHGPHDAEDLT